MVGKRKQLNKNCLSAAIEDYIPKNNLYRRLKQVLDLSFLYDVVKPYYGKCGQKSVDPVVFFKLQLVAHFENLCSERALIKNSQLRVDILYFLDYNLGERLPGPEIRFHLWSATVPCLVHASAYQKMCLKLVSNTF